MTSISSEAVWSMEENEFADLLATGTFVSKPKIVRFYAPSFMPYKTGHYCVSQNSFPTISLTGKSCALRCKHCGGKVLETMYPAATPENLFDLCVRLKRNGALGCLISGGCMPDGSVPLGKFLSAIAKVKSELGLTVFVHTGIIHSEMAERLQNSGVDAALIDVIGSEETIQEIYNLNITVKDYENSLEALHRTSVVFVPHVIVGLHYGKLRGEFKALEMISNYEPSALVVIAFMPIHGAEMANITPPKPMDIARVLATARLMFAQTPLVLGCMRPKGRHRAETDVLALKAGVNAIAFPSEEVIKFAEDQGYCFSFSPFCCSQIYTDIRSPNDLGK